jgi:hypothetical protein
MEDNSSRDLDRLVAKLKTSIIDELRLVNYRVTGWTPMAIELWHDKKFIEKRIEEQRDYLEAHSKSKKGIEYRVSAVDRLRVFEERLKELT